MLCAWASEVGFLRMPALPPCGGLPLPVSGANLGQEFPVPPLGIVTESKAQDNCLPGKENISFIFPLTIICLHLCPVTKKLCCPRQQLEVFLS